MIITDILCAGSCLKLFMKYRHDREVYFVMRGNALVDRLTFALLLRLGWKFMPLEYELKPIAGGREPFFDVRKELDAFFERFIAAKLQEGIYKHRYFSEYEKKRIATYLELELKKKLYRSVEILYVLGLLQKDIGRPRAVLLLSSVWQREITALYNERGYEVSFYKVFFPWAPYTRPFYLMDYFVKASFGRALNSLSGAFYLFLKVGSHIVNGVSYWIIRHFNRAVPSRIGTFDIVAIIPGYMRTEWFNDLCWKQVPRERGYATLAMLFGTLDESAYDTYGYLAERWVSPNRFSRFPHLFSIYYWLWPLYPKVLIRNISRLLRGFRGENINFNHWFELINLWIEVSRMEALFILTGAKILWTNIEGQDLSSLAGSIAINRLGGVSIGSTWSMFGVQDFRGYRNTLDIWFIWGDKHVELFQEEVCKAMVICGYPGDFYLEDHLKKAKELRKAWQERYGAETIITLYDNAIGYDIQHFFTPTFEYLEKILRWVHKETKNLFVIKSKHKAFIDSYPRPILDLLRLLEAEKRLIYEFKKADLAPGLAADLVVGFGITTLPSLLGTYGKDVILLDINGINMKNSADAKNIRFIKRPEEIVDCLEQWKAMRQNGEIEREITIQSKPDWLDSFADGRASQRISEYISYLMNGLINGLGSNKAIEAANKRYGAHWGNDKIVANDRFGAACAAKDPVSIEKCVKNKYIGASPCHRLI